MRVYSVHCVQYRTCGGDCAPMPSSSPAEETAHQQGPLALEDMAFTTRSGVSFTLTDRARSRTPPAKHPTPLPSPARPKQPSTPPPQNLLDQAQIDRFVAGEGRPLTSSPAEETGDERRMGHSWTIGTAWSSETRDWRAESWGRSSWSDTRDHTGHTHHRVDHRVASWSWTDSSWSKWS